ncbi:site-specific integrase [Campylobacter majalis]
MKSPKKEIEPFNADEVHAILNLAKLHQSLNFYLFLSIGFFTGMRTGEILALKLKDINLNNGVIYVNATRSRFGESSPKTELSRRVVPIIDDLEPILIKAFKSFKFRSSDDYVLLNSNLKPYRDTEIFTKKFKTILNCLDIKYRRLYTMRHTYATNMLRANLVSPLELSYLLGHSTAKMIYDVYVKYINKNLDSFNRSIKIYN